MENLRTLGKCGNGLRSKVRMTERKAAAKSRLCSGVESMKRMQFSYRSERGGMESARARERLEEGPPVGGQHRNRQDKARGAQRVLVAKRDPDF